MANNLLSTFIKNQLPEFVQTNYPVFVAFLKAYYEWLESNPDELQNLMELKNVGDIDTTFDRFVSSFKNQYLLDFPESLAINSKTNQPVDQKTLIKNIKAFYRAKGTEKSFELLFRILYDTSVQFYYPKIDILKVSDGKWIQTKSLRVTNTLGNSVFSYIGKKIYQTINNTTVGTAVISNINVFYQGIFEIQELFITNISGTFTAGYPIVIENNSETLEISRIYSTVTSITITDGGSNYKVGDRVIFTNASGDYGIGAKAKVVKVNTSGKILKIDIENFGVNYNIAPTITIQTDKGTGFSGTANVGALCSYPGYYANNDGKLSSNKVLQDNHYYQNYSYVLKSEIIIDRYKEIVKRLIHPAGLGFFGQILIKRIIQDTGTDFLNIIKNFYPRIGHYAPYTFNTLDNLQRWFIYNGDKTFYDSVVHDPILTDKLVQGNPISKNKTFIPGNTASGASGYIDADPFWIIYPHPNLEITGNHTVRIYSGHTSTFSLWSEWQAGLTTTGYTKATWLSGFTGDYQYAVLKYSPVSQFYKISVDAFLNIPRGSIIDTRYDNGIVS